jgi:hypothetical protein
LDEKRWVDITKEDASSFNVDPITALAFHVVIPEGADVSQMTDSIKQEVQKHVDIGEFNRMIVDGNHAMLEYDVSDDQVIGHVDNIKQFLAEGFTVDGNKFEIESVMIPSELHPDVSAAFEAAEVPYKHIKFNCALRQTDLTPRHMMTHEETSTEPPATEAPTTEAPGPVDPTPVDPTPVNPVPVDPSPPVTPAPVVAETSGSAFASLAAFALAGLAALV